MKMIDLSLMDETCKVFATRHDQNKVRGSDIFNF